MQEAEFGVGHVCVADRMSKGMCPVWSGIKV